MRAAFALVLAIALALPLDAQETFYVSGRQAKPTIAIATATADTQTFPTSGVKALGAQWKFGTVVGTYSTCTAQAKTSYDGGSTFLTMGTAVTVTATSTTVNAWTVIAQLGTTSVTTTAVSATAALSFGNVSKFTFACSSYGTSAPVTVSTMGLN